MNINPKVIRDETKFLVFAHLSKALIVYILSSIISTVIVYNMQITVLGMNTPLDYTNPKTLGLVYGIIAIAFIVNLPLTFCAHRFYLALSRHTTLEPLPLKTFFEPFMSISLFLKGSMIILLTLILEVLGIFVLIFPVWLAFFPAIFVLADDPEISLFGALKKSAKIMKGNKMIAFKTLLPFFAFYIIATLFFNSFYFLSFFVTAISQLMIYVAFAMIYDKSRQNH